jgi:carbon storage regulator
MTRLSLTESVSAADRGRRGEFVPPRIGSHFPGEETMLVLSRRVGQQIAIGEDVHVTVVSIRGEHVRLGIVAPANTVVDRQEIHKLRTAQRAAQPPPEVN